MSAMLMSVFRATVAHFTAKVPAVRRTQRRTSAWSAQIQRVESRILLSHPSGKEEFPNQIDPAAESRELLASVFASTASGRNLDLENTPATSFAPLSSVNGRMLTANAEPTYSEQAGDPAIRANRGFNSNSLAANDDGSTAAVTLGFSPDFYGTTYSRLYVNNNGNVTFDAPLDDYTPFTLNNTTRVIIAAFFADVDTRGTGSGVVTYGTDSIDGHPAFGVNWINVGYFSQQTSKTNDFQLIIVDRSDTGVGNFDFEFNYRKVTWETGSSSGGTNGLGGNSARVGFSNGSNKNVELQPNNGTTPINGALLDTNTTTGLIYNRQNSLVTGRYRFQVRNGDVAKPEVDVFDSDGTTPIPNGTGNISLTATAVSQSQTRTVRIRNNGQADLYLGNAVASGSSAFSIQSQPAAVLAPQGETNLQIRFAPTSTGMQNGRISIPTNDDDERPYTFDISGYAYNNVDLVVSDISVTSPTVEGGDVDVTWTVRNRGTGDFQGSFSDRIFLSSDQQIGGDVVLQTFAFSGTLIAGGTVTRTQRVTLPAGQVGSKYIVARTDVTFQVTETEEQNNTSIDDQALVIQAPDFRVYDVQAGSPLETGQSTTLTWKVQNIGTASTANGATWRDQVYLSTDTILDANDVKLGASVVNPQTLGVNESYSSSSPVTIPYGTYGVRYLLVKSDDALAVTEITEANNFASSSLVNINWQPPDLRVTNVVSQFFGFAGTTTRVSWDVTNVGLSPMRGSEADWSDRVWLSTDATLDAGDRSLGIFPHSGLLNRGESYTQTVDVGLPVSSSLAAGNYFVIVETDRSNQVLEGPFETNNASADNTTLQFVHTPPPDLVVSSVGSPPTQAYAGQSLDVQFTVRNAGAGATEPRNTSWYDRVYLSADGILDGNDRALRTVLHTGGLSSQGTYHQTFGVTLPGNVTGTYRLLVATDVYGDVFGDVRTNNTGVSVGTIVIAPAPADLDVISLTPVATTAVVNNPLTFNYEVKNIGPQATNVSTWKDRLYFSLDNQLDVTDPVLGETVHNGVLPAGASYQGSISSAIAQTGSFFVFLKSDADGSVVEVFQANNTAAATQRIQVVPTPADLTTSQVTAPSSARAGAELTLGYRVTNTGPNTTLATAWTDRIYLSADPVLDEADRLIGTQARFGELTSADFYDVSASVSLPEDLSGQYYVLVQADGADNVFETDQADNVSASANRTNLLSQPADLVVSAVTPPGEALAGSALRLDWTERNSGTGDTVVSSWKTRVYLSSDNVFNPATDTLLGAFAYTNKDGSNSPVPLAANTAVNRSELVTLPSNATGSQFLFMVVDSDDVVFESQDNNNVSAATPVSVVRSNVDLRVTSIAAPSLVTEGVPFAVSWTVENIGTAATRSTFWYDEVYISQDRTFSGDDVRLGTVRHSNPLGANDNYTASSTFTAPLGLTMGAAKPFYVLVRTDSGDTPSVIEIDETNNQLAISNPLTVNPGSTAPLPNLQVVSVQAPVAAQAGQPVTVNWTVRNSSQQDLIAGEWYDAVYLSLDPIFDRASDIYLGFSQQSRTLAAGGDYTQTATFTLSSQVVGDYYVLVVADGGKSISESQETTDNIGASSATLSVQAFPPADLVVGTITIPVNGLVGQQATISYDVKNNGANTAVGSWYDSVYISADETWDVNDPLFGRTLHSGNLAPAAMYTQAVTGRLPALLPGNYRVIVRSDIRNNIVESNEQNNISGSLNTMTLDVPALTLGAATNVDLAAGDSAYFKVVVPADQTLSLAIDSLSATGETQVFISKDVLPSPSAFEYTSAKPGGIDRTLLVPDTLAATYYVRVSRISSPGANPRVSVTANLVPFSAISTDVSRVGNAGSVTMGITGTQLKNVSSIELYANPTHHREATRFTVANSSLAFATFDLNGLAIGTYSLVLRNSAGETATLSNAVKVETARSGSAKLSLSSPSSVRAGQTLQATLTVYNDGNTDVAAPLVQVDSDGALLMGLRADDLEDFPLTVVVVPTDGFRDTLRPGQSVQIPVYAQEKSGVSGTTVNLTARSIGQSNREIALTPLLSDSEIEEQFGAEAEYIKLLLESLQEDTEAEIVESLVAAGGAEMASTLGYADAMAARSTQLAMVTYLAEYLDINALAQLINDPQSRIASENIVPQPLGASVFDSEATFDEIVWGSSGKVKYIVPGFLAAETTPDWARELALELHRVCPDDSVVVVNWKSGSEEGLKEALGVAFIEGALKDLAKGSFRSAMKIGLKGTLKSFFKGGAIGVGLEAGGYYPAAALKTKDVGNAILRHMELNRFSPSMTTIYGHSLGAQAAGFAGAASAARGAKIGKIVGFDPAGVGFILGPNYRLDKSDAQNVDVIHTSKVFGRYCDSGHNDYYPALPAEQGLLVGAHAYSYLYYIEKLKEVETYSCGEPNLGTPESHACTDNPFDNLNPYDQEVIKKIPVVNSKDPNDILGPQGFGPENWVAVTQPLDYTIRFENDPEFATAPAQEIRITQTLDADLDLGTFRLGAFGFGDLTVDVPADRSFYSTRLDLRATKGIYVDVFAGVNAMTRQIFWNFTAIDPVTGDLPTDPLQGLLPPNLAPPEGDGFVRYSIRAKATAPTGTRIESQARIVFDVNEPIDTPSIFHTIDAVAPTSRIESLETQVVDDRGRFTVRWSGLDDAAGSAIRDYDIYVSVDKAPFIPWLTGVTYTEAIYDGPSGDSYAFYSVARDNSGMSEATPAGFDVTTNRPPEVVARQFMINENSASNAFIGTIVANDPDASQTKTFAIASGNTNDAFAIHPVTGVLSVKSSAALNYESVQQFNLIVTVTDNGFPAQTGSASVVVFLRDVNEFSPVVGAKQFLIGENSADGAFIGTIPSTDQDTLQTRTFVIKSGNTGDAFSIEPATGNLRVNNSAALNYEAIQQFDLMVQVTDSGNPARTGSAAVTVFLSDRNDPPVVTPKQFMISENSANNAFIGTIAASDQDAGQTRTFAITGGNTNNAFAIDPHTGVLKVNSSAALNYEAIQQFDLTVTVTDNGNPARTGSAPVTVFLKDINEFNPVVAARQFLIGENSANGAFIGTIQSTDNDTLQTRTFAITGGNTNQAFVIDPNTGVLKVNNSAALNYESVQKFDLIVTVTDSGNPARTGSTTVTVFLSDKNDPPVVTPAQFSILENSSNRMAVGTVVATDQDAGQTRTFTITSGNTNDAFAIHSATGQITVANAAALDFETTPVFNLTVRVTDNGVPASSSLATIRINLTNVNDVPKIGGAVANQAVNDTTTVMPFSTLTLIDPDTQAMAVAVTINNGMVRGDFTTTSANGWTRSTIGNDIIYSRYYESAANNAATMQAAIRALVFQPRRNAIKPNTTETTAFTVTVSDGVASPVSDTTTSVIATSINNIPAIDSPSNTVAVNDNATVNPFATLTVTEPDMQEMLISVTILNGVVRGDFTAASVADWPLRYITGNNITYKRYFDPQVNVGAAVQAAFRALVFQPRTNAIKPGTTEATDFQLTVSDGVAPAVINQTIRVITTSVNQGPTIGGAVANQTINDNQTKSVFSTLTVSDPDTQDLFVRITIANGTTKGDFTATSTTGWNRIISGSQIVYERFFAAAANNGAVVQAAIRSLEFQPRSNVPVGTTETTTFSVYVNDGLASATNSTTSVITTGVAPRQFPESTPATVMFLDSDITTLVLPTIARPRSNALSRLWKKPAP